MSRETEQVESRGLTRFLSPSAVWAYGVGTAIGWGSFVVTTNQYLLQAGPLGSVLGMVTGTLIMLVVGRSYAFLMSRYPGVGGTYSFVKHALGNDFAFIAAWFLGLSYLAVFWANITSLPLFIHYFFGDVLKRGYLYRIFDYDVYAGEVLVTIGAILVVGIVCTRSKRLKAHLMVALALVFTIGIGLCGVGAILSPGGVPDIEPFFLPERNIPSQLFGVTLMTPWAYIGFESVSHSTEEFAFPISRSRRLMVGIVLTTSALYIIMILLSVSAYPERYVDWFAYLSDLPYLRGIESLPPFYAAYHHMGDAGLVTLMLALLALVLTSFIGNAVALARLLVALSRDGLMGRELGDFAANGTPTRAILFICAVSLVVPFLGRTTIGWIVDITTIGAVIVYGLVSASAMIIARREHDKAEEVVGTMGLGLMLLFGGITLLPSVFMEEGLAQETYFLVTVWSMLGFMFFRAVLRRDSTGTYGNSIVVWGFLLSLVLFSSTVWMQKVDRAIMDDAIVRISDHLRVRDPEQLEYVQNELVSANQVNVRSSLIVTGIFVFALGMTISDYRYVRRRQEQADHELGEMREVAYTDPLTGVKSKNAFSDWRSRIDERIGEGSLVGFAVVVCDVNELKRINDTLGHASGDTYIRTACRTICTTFKHSPVFRIGGDEFVVLLEGEDFDARQVIMDAFAEEQEQCAREGRLAISAGISVFRRGIDHSFQEIFDRADTRMYDRKAELKILGTLKLDGISVA